MPNCTKPSINAPDICLRRVLTAARNRYWSMPLTERPGDVDHVLTQAERITLINAGMWPLSRRAHQHIIERPADRKRRERLKDRRIERVTINLLRGELPSALDSLLRSRRYG